MEKFNIEIETTGDYKTKKKFNKEVEMTDREFLGLVEIILDFLDKKNNKKETNEPLSTNN